jgi:aspartate kinase
MYIYKFGGTSVGNADRMRQVAQLITQDQEKKIVVLSAVSGTTNSLVEIADLFSKGDEKALIKSNELREKYWPIVDSLFATEKYKLKGRAVVNKFFDQLNNVLSQPYYNKMDKVILAQGELISTNLFYEYSQELGLNSFCP